MMGIAIVLPIYDLTDEEPWVISPGKPPANPTLAQAMTHRLKTGAEKAAFALNNLTIAPAFAIAKPTTVFHHPTHVLNTVQGKWTLACPELNRRWTDVFLPQQGKTRGASAFPKRMSPLCKWPSDGP